MRRLALTAGLAGALLIQAAAIAALRLRLGHRWLLHPVTLLVLSSAVYQGLSQAALAFPSVAQWDVFRSGIQPGYMADADLLLSTAMLALTVAYLLTRPERAQMRVTPRDAGHAARVLDWRVLGLACLPLAVITYRGHGYNGSVKLTAGTPLSTDLAVTFFTVLTILTAAAFVLRHGRRWFLAALIAQSALLAAAGERTPVIVGAITLVAVLARVGMRPPHRQIQAATVLALLGALAITGVRAEQGREIFSHNTRITTRLAALAEGLIPGAGSHPTASPGLVAQLAVRLDGTSFTAGILQAEHMGQPPLNSSYVLDSLLVEVPSFAWPAKLSHGDILNPPALQIATYGLQNINFLPGLPGMYAGYLLPFWLCALMALLGVVAGWGERWLLQSCTPARLVLLAGSVTAGLWFEKGLPDMLLAIRAALAIAVTVKLIEAARARWGARQHA